MSNPTDEDPAPGPKTDQAGCIRLDPPATTDQATGAMPMITDGAIRDGDQPTDEQVTADENERAGTDDDCERTFRGYL